MSWQAQGHCDLESEAVQAERTVARRKVLFVTSEISDYVQTGGLGEVSAALPRALRALSDVRILVPGYRQVLEGPAADAVAALRALADRGDVVLLDYMTNCDVDDLARPLSHAGLVGAWLEDRWPGR